MFSLINSSSLGIEERFESRKMFAKILLFLSSLNCSAGIGRGKSVAFPLGFIDPLFHCAHHHRFFHSAKDIFFDASIAANAGL